MSMNPIRGRLLIFLSAPGWELVTDALPILGLMVAIEEFFCVFVSRRVANRFVVVPSLGRAAEI
jgi:hypothetical protein